MFSETSYQTGVKGRIPRRSTPPTWTTHGPTGGTDVAFAPGYGPGSIPTPIVLPPAWNEANPNVPVGAVESSSSGGIMDFVKGLETWQLLAIAAGAWFFFFRKGR